MKVVEDSPIMSVKYCLTVPVFHFCPKITHHALQRNVTAITEQVVTKMLAVESGFVKRLNVAKE